MGKVIYLGEVSHTMGGSDSNAFIAELKLARPEGQITSLFCQFNNTGISGAGSYEIVFAANSWPYADKPGGWAHDIGQRLAVSHTMEKAAADTTITVFNGNRGVNIFSTGETGGIVRILAPYIYVLGTVTPTRTGSFTFKVWGYLE